MTKIRSWDSQEKFILYLSKGNIMGVSRDSLEIPTGSPTGDRTYICQFVIIERCEEQLQILQSQEKSGVLFSNEESHEALWLVCTGWGFGFGLEF